jgi:hypothetical protein
MEWIGIIFAAGLIGLIFVDAFEVMILPRRVRHPIRLARLFYRSFWTLWRFVAARWPAGPLRQGFLSIFGPLSLFLLILIWAFCLIFGFALLFWSANMTMSVESHFSDYLYFSGTTFFTLGYGDFVPSHGLGRFFSVAEAGIGFTFLAIIVSYLPVLYQAFSKREIPISLLDARAGSPPSAGELLRRLAQELGRRGARKPSVVSRVELLPFAARQSVVDRNVDDDARHHESADREYRFVARLSGKTDIRNGSARRGRFGAGVCDAAEAAEARSVAGG